MQIETLNENYTNKKISMHYPALEVLEIDQALPVILPSIESGNLPLIGTMNGVTRQLATIDSSALNISKLLAISKLVYHTELGHTEVIATIEDIFTIGVGL